MGNKTEKSNVNNAIIIGFTCVFIYAGYYYLKNVLSVFTPQMIENSEMFTKESIAGFTSVYMILYAVGQLINGTLGDVIHPRYMILSGLSLAGAAMFVFPLVNVYAVRMVCFAVLGFGVSMLRGPLVKVFSENTLPHHARIISVFFSFVFFVGPLIAGVFAVWMKWNTAFTVSAVIAWAMAAFGFVMMTVLEKRGIINHGAVKKEKKKIDIIGIFKIKSFIPFFLMGMIGEISGTSIIFWVPTYITERLGFPSNISGVISTVMMFAKALSPFVCLFLYKAFKGRAAVMIGSMFFLSALIYAAMIFIGNSWINLVLFSLAIAITGVSSSTIWSIYIPSLAKSGKVSGANGVMDSGGYFVASGASVLFGSIIENLGWNAIIITWCAVMVIGTVITLFARRSKAEQAEQSE